MMTINTDEKSLNIDFQTFTCQESKPKSPCLDDWTFIDDSSTQNEIEKSKKIFSDIAEQLHAHVDPFEVLLVELLPIIDYQRSDYMILCVKEGKLDYYMPIFPYGSYSSGEDVIAYVHEKIDFLKKFYFKQEEQNKWKVLKIARRMFPGLKLIIENYSKTSTYQDFTTKIDAEYQSLDRFISGASIALSSQVDHYLNHNKVFDIFDLLNIHADTYPKDLIIKKLTEYYGERLTTRVFNKFIAKENEASALTFSEEFGFNFTKELDRISYNQIYGVIFCMATNVDIEDLKWKYKKDNQNAPPFEELSDDAIDNLLAHFRLSPNGLNLLDYFGIRTSLDKHTVHHSFKELYPAEDIKEQSRINEMNVYADMEASKIWHPGQAILMADIQMFDQLDKIFNDPFNPQLFHTDKYISFLNVAATCIAYLQSFNRNGEAIKANLDVVIKKLEEITEHAHEMYPEGHVAKYESHWLLLIGKLRDACLDPEIDLSKYYLSLFAHPLQNAEEQNNTLKLHHTLQGYEYLARKVAYWNWNYLSNSHFVDEKGDLKNPDQVKHREGTLFYVSDGEKMELYTVKNVILRDGFCCQLCTPFNTDQYVQKGIPIPVKVIFQGTISNPHCIERDKYLKGAGYTLWVKEKSKLVIPELKDLMADLRTPYEQEKKPTFKVDFIGHSLGGSDAQNAASYLSEPFLTRNFDDKWISSINVHTFNTAGVPRDTIDRFNNNYESYQNKIGKITHSIVKNDIVSRSAQCKLGADFKDIDKVDIMEVSNLGIYSFYLNHCEYIHSWTDNILPHKKLCHKHDERSLQRYLFGMAHSWTDLKGHINDFVDESPIAKIAFAALYIIGISFGNYQLKLLGEGVLFLSTAAAATGVKMINDASESFTKGQISGSVSDIWEAASSKWYGTQILEGTG